MVIRILFLLLLTLYSCKKYEPQFGLNNSTDTDNKSDITDLILSNDGAVYLINAEMTTIQKIATIQSTIPNYSPRVAIAAAHDKIAYTDENGSPIIADISGNILTHLTQYTNVMDLGWYNEDKTLCILANNQLFFHGESMNLPLPHFVFPTTANSATVHSFDINENLDLVYALSYYENQGSQRKWYTERNRNYKNLADKSDRLLSSTEPNYQPLSADNFNCHHIIRWSETGDYSTALTRHQSGSANLYSYLDFQLQKQGFKLTINEYDNGSYNYEYITKELIYRNPSSLPGSSPLPFPYINDLRIYFKLNQVFFDWKR